MSPIWKSATTPVGPAVPPYRFCLLLAMLLACFLSLSAADLHVKGLGLFDNHAAEQKIKLLLGGQYSATVNANSLEDAALVLVSELNREGYLEPVLTLKATLADSRVVEHTLNAQLEPPLPRPLEATSVTLHIAKGRRFTLREINFTGLLAMTEKDARAFFVGEDTLLPLAAERIYSPGRLQSSADNLEEALRRLGYAEAEVTADQAQVDRASGDVRVKINVQEGPQWVVTALHYEIADGSAPPDNVASERGGQLWTALWRQDTATAIRRWYYARGHPDVQIKLLASTTPAADGTRAVTALAQVVPGPEVRVGEVRFTGNTHTRDATLRRLARSQPGAPLNPIRFNDSQARISQLGVFRSVDLRYDPADATTRDAVFDLVEGRRQEINLLAGYGSYEQLRGGVEWRHYNLFGRAHTDTLKLVQSMKGSEGDYTYTVRTCLAH